MKNEYAIEYAKIVALVERGVIGKPQVIIASVNTNKGGAALAEKIASELILCDGIVNVKRKNESVKTSGEGYPHGFVSREYEGGQLFRYTYTSAPIGESTQLTVYGNDGEIRFDSTTGKIFTLKQVPDYVGDEVTEDILTDGVIDFVAGKIGKTTVCDTAMDNDLAVARKVAGMA